MFHRWQLVIHGAVDGFSRVPVYLHCSTNNEAATVLALFKEAVSTYGLPSRVRCGENVDVSMFMLSHSLCGPGRGTVIVGKSVHNQVSITTCSVIWKAFSCWIQTMRHTSSVCTMYIFCV